MVCKSLTCRLLDDLTASVTWMTEPTQVPDVDDHKRALLSSVQREVRMIRTTIHSTLSTLRKSDRREQLHDNERIYNNRMTCMSSTG